MNARDRLPVAIGAGLLVATLGGFQAVVTNSVEMGAARRAELAQSQRRAWRCRVLRGREPPLECLAPSAVAAAAAP